MSSDDFTFPDLSQLPRQNPLLAGATVVDKTAGTSTSPSARPNDAHPLSPPQPPAQPQRQPVPVTQQPTSRPRKKILYEKGYSQMDWVRISKSMPHTPQRRDITLEEVALHKSKDDAWMVLRGRVYNITPYMKFHPGGEDILMKAAGRDGTALFNKYHAWVNADFLLGKCLVGSLAPAVAAAIAE